VAVYCTVIDKKPAISRFDKLKAKFKIPLNIKNSGIFYDTTEY
jgi:hypothetical protein